MRFWLCIDDTDDATKNIGTGVIAKSIFQELRRRGCYMKYSVTRHQLLLSPEVPYTSHNSAMCMEGEGILPADEIWNLALTIVGEQRSPVSNPGICMYVPQWDSDEKRLISFGKRAKEEVLTISQTRTVAEEVPGVRISAPWGNGDGQVGALAGIGLRLSGNDGTFHGKVRLNQNRNVFTVREIQKALNINFIYDETGRKLNAEEKVRIKDQVKLVYRDFMRAAAVKKRDGVYEICHQASDYEQNIVSKTEKIQNCGKFQWDNDSGEQWSDKKGVCENCLHRRMTSEGMVCSII